MPLFGTSVNEGDFEPFGGCTQNAKKGHFGASYGQRSRCADLQQKFNDSESIRFSEMEGRML